MLSAALYNPLISFIVVAPVLSAALKSLILVRVVAAVLSAALNSLILFRVLAAVLSAAIYLCMLFRVVAAIINSLILFRVVAAVLSAALYPNIIKVLTPEVKYKQTATGIFLYNIIIIIIFIDIVQINQLLYIFSTA